MDEKSLQERIQKGLLSISEPNRGSGGINSDEDCTKAAAVEDQEHNPSTFDPRANHKSS